MWESESGEFIRNETYRGKLLLCFSRAWPCWGLPAATTIIIMITIRHRLLLRRMVITIKARLVS
jgi:hypothetical protein